jgi:membrane protease YdiL (CAAX protease family)
LTARSSFTGADGRLHAPWRLVLFLLLSGFCALPVVALFKSVLGDVEKFTGIDGTQVSIATAIALLVAHWVTFLTFDKRPWSFVWLDKRAAHPRQILLSIVLGGAPIGVVSLILLNFGQLDYEPTPDGPSLLLALQTLIVLLPAALGEELLSRGYLFATLREWLGNRAAVIATSLGFGLLHWANPNVSTLSIVLVTLAGVYLAVILLATGSMYAAWIAHFSWNWVMAAILHVPVSGIPLARPDYQIVDSGPDWLTGGYWGPEGGLAAGAAMIIAMAYLYWRFRGFSQQQTAVSQQVTAHPTNDRIEG